MDQNTLGLLVFIAFGAFIAWKMFGKDKDK